MEEKILRMFDDGDTYGFIANEVGVSHDTVYYTIMRVRRPDVFKKRQETRRRAQQRQRELRGVDREDVKKRSLEIRARHLSLSGKQLREYDNSRNIERYFKKKEIINPKRNAVRRARYAPKKAARRAMLNARNKKVIELRNSGLSLSQVGKRVGLSIESVRLIHLNGVNSKSKKVIHNTSVA